MTSVLYIEDNEDNIYMLSRRLEKRGFDVHIARDGKAGMEMARTLKPDIIILDLVLPELDGWKVASSLKADGDLCVIPILALSSSVMPDDRERALEAGCDDFDAKPVNFERLLGKMTALLDAVELGKSNG